LLAINVSEVDDIWGLIRLLGRFERSGQGIWEESKVMPWWPHLDRWQPGLMVERVGRWGADLSVCAICLPTTSRWGHSSPEESSSAKDGTPLLHNGPFPTFIDPISPPHTVVIHKIAQMFVTEIPTRH